MTGTLRVPAATGVNRPRNPGNPRFRGLRVFITVPNVHVTIRQAAARRPRRVTPAESGFCLISVESIEFLGDLVAGDQQLAPAFSRQVAALAQKSGAQPEIQRQILLFQVLPEFLFLLQILIRPRLDGQKPTRWSS